MFWKFLFSGSSIIALCVTFIMMLTFMTAWFYEQKSEVFLLMESIATKCEYVESVEYEAKSGELCIKIGEHALFSSKSDTKELKADLLEQLNKLDIEAEELKEILLKK